MSDSPNFSGVRGWTVQTANSGSGVVIPAGSGVAAPNAGYQWIDGGAGMGPVQVLTTTSAPPGAPPGATFDAGWTCQPSAA